MFQSRFKQQRIMTQHLVIFLCYSTLKASFALSDFCLLKTCIIFMVPKIDKPPGGDQERRSGKLRPDQESEELLCEAGCTSEHLLSK